MKERGTLLLPGGGMSSWIWSKIVPWLEFDAISPEYRLKVDSIENRENASLQDGIDSLPFLVRKMNVLAIKSQVKKESMPISDKAPMVKKNFCNTYDNETLDYVLNQNLLSEPLCIALEKVDWDDFPQLPQRYIILANDETQTVERQKK